MVCPSGAWIENRPHSMPSIRLARNPKHVIVQWVGIGTHTPFSLDDVKGQFPMGAMKVGSWPESLPNAILWTEFRHIRLKSNFNRDCGLHISKSWDPAISTLRRIRARGQHSTSAPVLTTPGVDQCTRCGEHPLWLDSSRNTHQPISELIVTIG